MNWALIGQIFGVVLCVLSAAWALLKPLSYQGGPDEMYGGGWRLFTFFVVVFLLVILTAAGTIVLHKPYESGIALPVLGLLAAFFAYLAGVAFSSEKEIGWREAQGWTSYWAVSFGRVEFYEYEKANRDWSPSQKAKSRLGLVHYYSGLATRHIPITLGSQSTKTAKVQMVATAEASPKEFPGLVREMEDSCAYLLTNLSMADASWETAREVVKKLSNSKMSVALLQPSWNGKIIVPPPSTR